MDPSSLISFLAPFLPYLVKAGQTAAEEAGERIGGASWEYAKRIWERLRPGVEQKPAAQEAAADVAARPDDEAACGALKWQLRKLFAEQPELEGGLAAIWDEARAAGVVVSGGVVASGGGSIAVGRDAHGTFITGDQNRTGT